MNNLMQIKASMYILGGYDAIKTLIEVAQKNSSNAITLEYLQDIVGANIEDYISKMPTKELIEELSKIKEE